MYLPGPEHWNAPGPSGCCLEGVEALRVLRHGQARGARAVGGARRGLGRDLDRRSAEEAAQHVVRVPAIGGIKAEAGPCEYRSSSPAPAASPSP